MTVTVTTRKKYVMKEPPRPSHEGYAIINGRIATVWLGRRIVRKYQSGEKLTGRIEE